MAGREYTRTQQAREQLKVGAFCLKCVCVGWGGCVCVWEGGRGGRLAVLQHARSCAPSRTASVGLLSRPSISINACLCCSTNCFSRFLSSPWIRTPQAPHAAGRRLANSSAEREARESARAESGVAQLESSFSSTLSRPKGVRRLAGRRSSFSLAPAILTPACIAWFAISTIRSAQQAHDKQNNGLAREPGATQTTHSLQVVLVRAARRAEKGSQTALVDRQAHRQTGS